MKWLVALACMILCSHTLFAQTPYKTLAPAAMQADLRLLQSAWTNLHPGLYRYNTPAQINGYFATLQQTCSQPMDERRFYIRLSQLAQRVHCGHTYLNPLNLKKQTRNRVLPAKVIPLFFEIVAGRRMVVTHNLSGNSNIKRGDAISAINGVPVATIIDSLLTVSRSDGRNALGKQLNNMSETPDEAEAYSLFDIYFPLFFGADSTAFNLTIKTYPGNKTQQVQLHLLTREERVAAYEQQFGKIPVDEHTWDYTLLDRQTAYMKFGTFAFWNSPFDEKRYVDSAFRHLATQTGIKNLVIDIRNNEGGDNTGDYILSYITTRRIGCDDPDRACYRYLRIPDSLLPHLDTWDNTFKQPKDATRFFVNELGLYEKKGDAEACAYIEPRPGGFRGRVFMLVNAKNSSAGYEMARNFNTGRLGTLVGEPTGGSQQGINGGEFFFFTLPNSTFEIDLPLIYNYHANKPDAGIVPRHTVLTTQKSIYEHKDAQLAFVMDLIKRGNSK